MQGGHRQPKILYPLKSREILKQDIKKDTSPTLNARDYKDPKLVVNKYNNRTFEA
jgi:hypothetical protein